ncbi:MAG: tRNA (N6-threonylcarbamoyladenosine(37)-N6)-methyltransferase TrmO [Candidatus Asgardarchaeia archaeon]
MKENNEIFTVVPIGYVVENADVCVINIKDEFKDGLLNLDLFSHIIILFWFHLKDTIDDRKVLQVHPHRNMNLPLVGVFASRSPSRPNPIGLSVAKLIGVKDNIIITEKIDAWVGTPIIDIKPYLPHIDLIPDAIAPW